MRNIYFKKMKLRNHLIEKVYADITIREDIRTF